MSEIYCEGIKYTSKTITKSVLPPGEYENCSFIDCLFTKIVLTNYTFIDCKFDNCEMNMSTLNMTSFRDVNFQNCKLMGACFNQCNPFLLSMSFSDSYLKLASFYGLKLNNTHFENCNLVETDFGFANLSNTIFHNCDMLNAFFDNTVLEKSDLTTSFNYIIDPQKNKIKKAKFSRMGLPGLLQNYDIEII